MLESEAYMTYRAYATGEKTLKPKTTKKKADSEASPKTKTTQATIGKRIKSLAKGDKAAKKKQPAETSMHKGLTVLSDVALTEAEQLKLVIERSKTQTHSSYASGLGADEGTGVKLGVPDAPLYNFDDEKISWKSSDEEDDDEVSLNDDDDNVANQDDDNDNEESDEEVQGANTKEEEMKEEATHEEDEANELYKDVNVNLEGRDTTMTDASLPNVLATRETEDTYLMLTAPINPEDVPVTTIVELPLVPATTLPPSPTPLITHILRDEAQAENEDFLNKLDDNIKKIIKEQVKEQVKAQVSKILPKIEKTVNEQLEVEVMTRSSTESKTSLAIAANLSELELKKILIEKMESNKRKDVEDKDEGPSAGSNWRSKRRRAGKEPESTSTPKEKTSKTTGKSTDGSKSQHKSAGESAHTEEPMHTDKDLEEPTYQEFDIGATEEQSDEETSQHPN
ncbi:hypothetical protein Tco_0151365 [Tanacetum coccineum]